ncbi:MAG: class I SAM-dependent methyltransferase [Nibricoccus sp.]
MEDPLKKAAGASAYAFLEAKVPTIRRILYKTDIPALSNPAIRWLDFGCGAGDFIHVMKAQGIPWQSEGCDISTGMLDEGRRRHPSFAQNLWEISADSFPKAKYDIITAVCVFHHIPPSAWAATVDMLKQALKPLGQLIIIEHNPWNPITRLLVKRAPIDQNAILLSSRKTKNLLASVGLVNVASRHFLFFPPRFKFLQFLEGLFSKIPLGGQYAIRAING